MFRAILVERDAQPYWASLKKLDESQLPQGEVSVRVEYSTINQPCGRIQLANREGGGLIVALDLPWSAATADATVTW